MADMNRPLLWSLRSRRGELEIHPAQPPGSLSFEVTWEYNKALKIQGEVNMLFTRQRRETLSKSAYSLVLKKKCGSCLGSLF